MLRYVQERVTHDPALVRERYAGRTLLHEASAQGNLMMVELLLRLGADPNAQDEGGHTPLYCVANEYGASEGGGVVRALAQGGANVNANDGVKHCTALHMAARRGNLEIAGALLDCGADIDARDSLGDTPLRRSVNCDKIQVASLLLARGADVLSIGNKGLTPLQAARTSGMKQLLRSGIDASSHKKRIACPTFPSKLRGMKTAALIPVEEYLRSGVEGICVSRAAGSGRGNPLSHPRYLRVRGRAAKGTNLSYAAVHLH
jgi:hypothetical protein